MTDQPEAARHPVLDPSALPYGLPDFAAISDADLEPAIRAAIDDHAAEIEAIVSLDEDPTVENTVIAFERSGQALDRALSTFYGLLGPDATPARLDVDRVVSPLLAAHHSAVMTHPVLYSRVEAVATQLDAGALDVDDETARLVRRHRRGLLRARAGLDAGGSARATAIVTRPAAPTPARGSARPAPRRGRARGPARRAPGLARRHRAPGGPRRLAHPARPAHGAADLGLARSRRAAAAGHGRLARARRDPGARQQSDRPGDRAPPRRAGRVARSGLPRRARPGRGDRRDPRRGAGSAPRRGRRRRHQRPERGQGPARGRGPRARPGRLGPGIRTVARRPLRRGRRPRPPLLRTGAGAARRRHARRVRALRPPVPRASRPARVPAGCPRDRGVRRRARRDRLRGRPPAARLLRPPHQAGRRVDDVV